MYNKKMIEEFINALVIDCKGEGCTDEETEEVIASFLQPIMSSVMEEKRLQEEAYKTWKEHQLFDDEELDGINNE